MVGSPVTSRGPSVAELVRLLASAKYAELGYRGVFTEYERGQVSRRWRVWRLRDLARVEDPPGRLSLLAGASTQWRSWPVDRGSAVIPREDDNRFDFELGHLVGDVAPERYWRDWLSRDRGLVQSTLQAVEHGGRPPWSFTAPEVKGAAPTVTVDAELGLVVRAERPDVGCYLEWTELRLDPGLTDDFFDQHQLG